MLIKVVPNYWTRAENFAADKKVYVCIFILCLENEEEGIS